MKTKVSKNQYDLFVRDDFNGETEIDVSPYEYLWMKRVESEMSRLQDFIKYKIRKVHETSRQTGDKVRMHQDTRH